MSGLGKFLSIMSGVDPTPEEKPAEEAVEVQGDESEVDDADNDEENDQDDDNEDGSEEEGQDYADQEQTPAEVQQLQQQIKDLQARLDRAQNEDKAQREAEREQKTKQRIEELLTSIKNDDLPSGESISTALRELMELTGQRPEEQPASDPTVDWATRQPDYAKVVAFAKENQDVHQELLSKGVRSEQAMYFALKEVMQKRERRKTEKKLKGKGTKPPGRVPKTGPGNKRGALSSSSGDMPMSPMGRHLLENGGRLR